MSRLGAPGAIPVGGPGAPAPAPAGGRSSGGVKLDKKTTLIVGAIAAVGLGLISRRHAASSAAAAPIQYGYDSAQTDIGQVHQQLSDLNGALNMAKTPKPAKAPVVFDPNDTALHYAKFANSDNPRAVYAIQGGVATPLTFDAWTLLGRPNPQILTTSDPLWQIVTGNGVAQTASYTGGQPTAPSTGAASSIGSINPSQFVGSA